MTNDMVRLAFDQTVDSIGKISFPYMDKVMANWHQQGLKTPLEVEKANQSRKAAKPEEKPSYDMNLINKRFLRKRRRQSPIDSRQSGLRPKCRKSPSRQYSRGSY